MLENLAGRIDYIRSMRDELHTSLMKWDEVIPPVEGDADGALRRPLHRLQKTYQFLAQNFQSRSDRTTR